MAGRFVNATAHGRVFSRRWIGRHCGFYRPSGFDLSQWSRARVNIDYHLSFDGSVCSVQYMLTAELVEARSTATTVEIFTRTSAWPRICAPALAARR